MVHQVSCNRGILKRNWMSNTDVYLGSKFVILKTSTFHVKVLAIGIRHFPAEFNLYIDHPRKKSRYLSDETQLQITFK